MTTLFDPLPLGDLTLKNRIIMAPLTRSRSGPERIPNALMAEYYSQRAGAGLILTEATAVSPMGVGYANTPGIWSDEQVEGWKAITKAVHDKGSLIFMQLWHVGRISHPMFLNGQQPVAPSAIAAKGHVSLVRPLTPYPTPRALETAEIAGIIEAYRRGAENAKKAGFDGVELHAANGYLIDQFLHSGSNQRTDHYGGSIENRARLLLELTDACISVWGANRVGVHLSPRGDIHDLSDENPSALFGYVATELGKRKIAFIFTREHLGDNRQGPALKQKFGGVLIANEKLTKEAAETVLHDGEADAVSFGQLYIANPDLAERLAKDAPLNKPNPATYYADGATGYTDYPFMTA